MAYSLDLVGENEAAKRYYYWAHDTIIRYSWKIDRLREKLSTGEIIQHDDYLHTRYDLEGNEGKEPWGNFQLDGYGTYLWGVIQHSLMSGNKSILEELSTSIKNVERYLLSHWSTPNFDCWEENPDKVHTSTLGCIYGGLKSLDDYNLLTEQEVLKKIKKYIKESCICNGHLVKFPGTEAVDASLLWLTIPFGVFDPDHPTIIKTVEFIEEGLTRRGVHRYPWDNYYGGGEWILLTAWLGWYYTKRGNRKRAMELLARVESLVDEEGQLPEQVPDDLFNPDEYLIWQQRWGEIAKPLLWSHAMYLVLKQHLRQ